MTETAKIAANNSFARQLADADAAHTEATSELNRYVAAEKDAAADKLYEREWAEDQRTYEREWAEEQWQYQKDQDAAAKQEEAYNEMMAIMRNGEYGTVADLENYLFEAQPDASGDPVLKGDFTEAQKRNLLHMYNVIANDPEQEKADEEIEISSGRSERFEAAEMTEEDHEIVLGDGFWYVDETDLFGAGESDGREGDNFEIKLGDRTYEVERGKQKGKSSKVAKAFEAYAGRKPKKGEIFAYNGKLYGYLPINEAHTRYGYQQILERDGDDWSDLMKIYGG